MAKTKTSVTPQQGLTRGKAVLIGVLAIVLVGVLYVQYGHYGGGSNGAELELMKTSANTTSRTRPAVPNAAPAESAAEPGGETQAALMEFDQEKWKAPVVDAVVAHDPFALPDGFPRPMTLAHAGLGAGDSNATEEERSKQLADALAELRMQLDELKQRGVHVIIGQEVAMIGDRVIHVGDEINGFTVTAIDPKDGVLVERKTSE